VSDLDRRRVVEVLDGRTGRIVERYLDGLDLAEREAIQVVAMDPYEPYRTAVRRALPRARIVVDPFHMVRGANTALDAVRRERQRAAKEGTRRTGARDGRRRRWPKHLFGARHRLLRGRERLREPERASLCELFAHDPVLGQAWGLKEAFRAVYRASDRSDAERRLDAFLAEAGRSELSQFTAFARGVELWREEILADFEEPTTNGFAEGVINKIKVIKRRAYGLPSFDSFRQRVILACG
jgi:transposase